MGLSAAIADIDTHVAKTGAAKPGEAQILSDWEEIPVSFREFSESPDHLAFPLSEPQYDIIEGFIGTDPMEFFQKIENRPSILVALLGKGSGKDTISRNLAQYVIYLLLCLREPRVWLGLHKRGFLDLVNVAYSEDQAKQIYFAPFAEQVKGWKWLRRRYRIYAQGQMVSRPTDQRVREAVKISDNLIAFPKGLRALSRHSQQESYEGHDIVFWVMDEASAFKNQTKVANGDKVYNTLRTSANSRIPGRWRGVVISYPRGEADTDFTMRLYGEAVEKPHEFRTARGAPWEFRPKGSFSVKTFEFEGHQIPVDFQPEFTSDPTDSRAKYLTIPPKISGAFFEYPERIDECIDKTRAPIFRTRETLVEVDVVDQRNNRTVRQRLLGQEVSEWMLQGVRDMTLPRVAWTDLGRSRNRAALVIARGEPVIVEVRSESGETQKTTVNKVIEEAVVVWTPNPEKGLQVAVASVETLILDLLRRGLRIRMFGCDSWNSATLQETMKRHRLYTEEHTIGYDDYTLLQMMIYTGAMTLLDHPIQYHELTRLIRSGKDKVDHPPEGPPSFGSKDIADCLAGCCRLLNGQLKDPARAMAAAAKRAMGVRAVHTSSGNASSNPFSVKSQGFPISGRDMAIAAAGASTSQSPQPAEWSPLPGDIRPRRSMGLKGYSSGGRTFSQSKGGRMKGW